MKWQLTAITAFRLTTAEPERLACFYEGLGFEAGVPERIPEEEIALLGLKGNGRRLPLRLGGQQIDLDSFDDKGRPYPAAATSADLCFQHFALVTDEVGALWAQAVALGAQPISVDGPVTLPSSAGGVTAVKFRDIEGHPLELLQFPPESNDRWRGTGLLGIDHTAISVSDAGASCRFYQRMGLSVVNPMLNHGHTQFALDGLPHVEVDVVPMMPLGNTPHLELLGYRKPIGRTATRMEANDVAATRTVWEANANALIHDPDGHLHLLRTNGAS
jgi:catechol 2,3-dioxygenase-like lactoylglutathione lyase family enzyme